MAETTEPTTSSQSSAIAEVEQLASQLQANAAEPKRSLDDLDLLDRETDIRLKRTYAKWLLWLLGAQILVSDVLVYLYAGLGRDWDVPGSVIQAWLAATVVQLVGVVLVVTRYLFPRRS